MIPMMLLLMIGFVILIKGADWLVDGASSLARRLKISDLVIGLTVVAFGTSTPELFVNIYASFQGNAEIAIGNILGSNIFNILFILGVSSLIYPLSVNKGTVLKEIPFSLLAAVVLGALSNDAIFDGADCSRLTRIDGLVFISFFGLFLYYIAGIAKEVVDSQQSDIKKMSLAETAFKIAGGLLGLACGGKLVQDGAVAVASDLGVSQSLIGLTIVAAGTSLPELATSAVAAYKKNSDIAVGNIVGSNIFNIFYILGISALIKPLPIAPQVNADILTLIATSMLLFLFMFTGKRRRLDRWEGAVFIVFYVCYVFFLITRG